MMRGPFFSEVCTAGILTYFVTSFKPSPLFFAGLRHVINLCQSILRSGFITKRINAKPYSPWENKVYLFKELQYPETYRDCILHTCPTSERHLSALVTCGQVRVREHRTAKTPFSITASSHD